MVQLTSDCMRLVFIYFQHTTAIYHSLPLMLCSPLKWLAQFNLVSPSLCWWERLQNRKNEVNDDEGSDILQVGVFIACVSTFPALPNINVKAGTHHFSHQAVFHPVSTARGHFKCRLMPAIVCSGVDATNCTCSLAM